MLASLFLLAAFFIGCFFTQSPIPTDAQPTCVSLIDGVSRPLTSAEVDAWFVTGAASLNGVVKPANSVTFPDDPNCSFYKWSHQMFLWLTSKAPSRYGGNGLIMDSPVFYDVSLPDPTTHMREFLPHTTGLVRAFNLRTAQRGPLDLPVIMEKNSFRILEILPTRTSPAGNAIVFDVDGKEVEVADVRVTNEKSPVLLNATGNAIKSPRAAFSDKSKDPEMLRVFDKLRRFDEIDRSSLVQKISVKKGVFFLDFAGNFHETEQAQADGGVLMAQNGSLVYYSLSVNNVFAIYRTMQGAAFATNGAIVNFPTTQLTLNPILAFATANHLDPVIDSEALAIEIKCAWVEAAGLPDIDKFIKMKAIVPTYDKTNPNDWVPNGTQTIELAMVGMHVVGSTDGHGEMVWGTFEHLSADPAAAYTYRTTGGGNTTIPQNTTGNWVFCASGATGPFNTKRIEMSGDHVVEFSGRGIGPSDIRRDMPWGLPGAAAGQNAEVISINHKVRSMLDPNDVRINYIQTGTTWTINGASPNSSNQVGTNRLANTTMETFTQGGNCFNCHFTNTTDVSHIFRETNPLF